MSYFGKICGFVPWQPDVRFSKTSVFCLQIHRKSVLANICLNFTFSTIFLLENGHRAIKVHVKKVKYCRAGHFVDMHMFFPDSHCGCHEVLTGCDHCQ